MEDIEKIKKRFYNRLPMYNDCNISVVPELSVEATAEKILKLMNEEKI